MRKFLRPDRSLSNDVTALVSELRREGIDSESVLEAIASIPRDLFVPEDGRANAWANAALPIGHGQTISQPYVVAAMTQALHLTDTDHVLEIGTGSGYQAAILSQLAGDILSIERIPALADSAQTTLARLGIENVVFRIDDGSVGWIDGAPYDAIIVTAGAPTVPPSLIQQLSADGGRLVIPVGDANGQDLIVLHRHGDRVEQRNLGPVAFVPLIGAEGWAPSTTTRSPDDPEQWGAIDPAVTIGHVHLKVADLERAIDFYQSVLGFEVTQRIGRSAAFLSAGGYHHHIGLNTWESKDGSPPPPGSTGLYHVALRYPTRHALAIGYQRLRDHGIRIDGAADHGVSQAIYLHDPDQHGLEFYWDRDPAEWPRNSEGDLQMFTEPLDLQALLDELRT